MMSAGTRTAAPAPAPGPEAELSHWLRWLEGLHPKSIDLGLDRLIPVRDALGLNRPGFRILTVAGTNGKGSSVALAEALLRADGCRTGAYTSPHLISFNERIRINGEAVSDALIVDALCQVEACRGDHSLSYFEYTTLAALLLFRQQGVDHAVLEVGLGGRLDAVNMLDADVSLLTRVALDHADWLGSDLAGIAREKAGICRPGRPAIIADGRPDSPLPSAAEATGAAVQLAGRDFAWQGADGAAWHWDHVAGHQLEDLPPLPWWQRPWQRDNASGAMAAIAVFRPSALKNVAQVRRVLSGLVPAGRVQCFPGPPETILDVAHNPDAAQALGDWLAARPATGRTRAVIGMKADKDISGVINSLVDQVDEWWPANLTADGGLSDVAMMECLPGNGVKTGGDPLATWQAVLAASAPEDRVLVLGSFLTVGPVLRQLLAAGQTGATSESAEARSL